MGRLFYVLLMLFLIAGFTLKAQENESFKAYWKNGFKVESASKEFQLSFGGRIMFDWVYGYQDAAISGSRGEFQNGTELRRARFFNSGTVYSNVKYKLEVDFAGAEVAFKDAYIQLTKLPVVGNLRAGQFKEPFRLESLNSSKYFLFMERSFHEYFLIQRNTGFMVFNDYFDSRLGWQAAFFRRSDDSGDDVKSDDERNVTIRIAGLPYKNEDGDKFVHLGLAFTTRNSASNEFKIAARPESNLAPSYISTGTIENVENVNMWAAEAAWVNGPFSLQAEYILARVDAAESYSFTSYYGSVSYFLTRGNNHRTYKDPYGTFGRSKIDADKYFDGNNFGVWQMALRYSSGDLNDGSINGGKLNDITLGLNWHLNPVTRIMFNYVRADLVDVGNSDILQMRFQIDF